MRSCYADRARNTADGPYLGRIAMLTLTGLDTQSEILMFIIILFIMIF